MYRYGISHSAMILCQNRHQQEQVELKFPDKPAALFPNPFGLGGFPQPRPLSERPYVAWLGIFQHQKNLPLLFEIAQALPQISFRIAGAKGNTADTRTDQALDGLKVLPNVEFVGYLKRNEVMDFLGQAAALLNTSHYEGFSNTYLESFSCGTPVIAPAGADPGGTIEKLELGKSIKDKALFPEAILNLFKMGSSYGELAERCQSYVRKEHDPILLTRKMVEALGQVVG
jgi:glycosyltransferase involved in cell wall biosynthesis